MAGRGHKLDCMCTFCKIQKGILVNPKIKFKGKTYEEMYGVERAREIKEKQIEASTGVKFTDERRTHISESKKGCKDSLETRRRKRLAHLGKKHKPETIEKMKESAKEANKKRNKTRLRNGTYNKGYKLISKQEEKLWDFLRQLDFVPYDEYKMNRDKYSESKIFIKQWHANFLTYVYPCDIYIPSMKLIIECDGVYWHGHPEVLAGIKNKENREQILERKRKDKVRTRELEESGYKVLRLWDVDIKGMTLQSFENILKKYD